jgi:plastocyanin
MEGRFVMHAVLVVLLALAPLGGTFPGRAPEGGPRADRSGDRREYGVPYPGGWFGQGETTVVSVENFRFCSRVCRADSVAYVRTPAGPVPGSDNPRAVVYMAPGASVTWTYRDAACDLVRCSGHDIRLEDGTGPGRRVGRVAAGSGRGSVGWTVPADAEPERVIRYFCARHATVGMTGAFQVLPIRVLSVSYPRTP